ncbi:MAG: ATP-binding cassette domain-containing protein [Comamonadaceae bacterium]|nr:ATP-binding cassette domain-containing protein [Comamonadaceae bacterium]
MGPNGAGKSTLFRMITGKEKPDSRRGRDRPDGEARLRRPVAARRCRTTRRCGRRSPAARDILTVGKFEMPSRAYLGRFNFKGGDQQKLVGNLSGGERGRLHLAKTLIDGRQRAAARRAVERPRRRDAARAGGRAARVRRLRAGDLARPLVPRPHLPPTSSPPRATRSGRSSPATTRSTRPRRGSASARKAPGRTGSATRRCWRRTPPARAAGPGRRPRRRAPVWRSPPPCPRRAGLFVAPLSYRNTVVAASPYDEAGGRPSPRPCGRRGAAGAAPQRPVPARRPCRGVPVALAVAFGRASSVGPRRRGVTMNGQQQHKDAAHEFWAKKFNDIDTEIAGFATICERAPLRSRRHRPGDPQRRHGLPERESRRLREAALAADDALHGSRRSRSSTSATTYTALLVEEIVNNLRERIGLHRGHT